MTPKATQDKSITALSRGLTSTETLRTDAPQDAYWLQQNVPCRSACPAGTDIPGYLEAVYRGQFDDAYRINLRDNVFPGVLGRVCSRPCEDACRHGWEGNGEPVAICFSKRTAADHMQRAPVRLDPWFAPTGKRIAVIGAGVAGLAAARDLTLFGHRVVMFEKHTRAGGMLNQGIPAFRLPRDVIDREIEQVIAQGVELRCNVAVGRDVTLTALAQSYDAVVMAAGTLRPNLVDVPGATLKGIEHGLQFLLEVNERGRTHAGKNVAVIGGGYTAMDCARTALRMGARVTVYYRRSRSAMVVLPGELEEFLKEGGTLVNDVAPVAFEGAGDQVDRIVFARTEATVREGARAAIVLLPDTEHTFTHDHVILATGQYPATDWIDSATAPRLVGRDQWLASGQASATAISNVFVAGDFALGATTLIQAIGHARECARVVDRTLMGKVRVSERIEIHPVRYSKRSPVGTTGRAASMNYIPLHAMPTQPKAQRTLASEVELGYDPGTGAQAAGRCYLCHYKFEIVDSRCVLCDECLKVKPVAGCIVEVAQLLRDESGRITGYQSVVPEKTDSLYYNRLWIDQNQCIRCGQCEAVCPVNAITMQRVSPVIESHA